MLALKSIGKQDGKILDYNITRKEKKRHDQFTYGTNTTAITAATTSTTAITTRKVYWVDTLERAKEVCDMIVLKDYRLLGFDMEGKNLGKDGKLSLIQIAVSQKEAYIFDVMTLGPTVFTAVYLMPILSNSSIIKLCYDCRCDAEILFCQYHVELLGFYDLQIVYTMLFQNKKDPFLKGLHKAMQKVVHGSKLSEHQDDLKIKLNAKKSSKTFVDDFMCRPVSKNVLAYCVVDVVYLFLMYNAWSLDIAENHYFVLWLTQERMRRFIYRSPSEAKSMIMSKLDFLSGKNDWFFSG